MNASPQMQRVRKARSTLLLDHPFFGVLALNLRLVDDPGCGTAWVNGVSLGFDPAFIDTLSDSAIVGLVAHETMHCACGHPWRRAGRDAKRWNAAADYAINSILANAGLTLPANGLIDPQYAGKAAEWIYDRLPVNDDGDESGDSDGDGDEPSTEVRDAPTDDPSGQAPTQADWQQATTQAQQQSRGSMSAGTRADIASATAVRVDWRALLRRYIQQVAPTDYTWSRPNTRYIPSGLYLPSLSAPSCGPIAVLIDTSGSIDLTLLGQFGAEMSAIADELQPESLTVVYCDTRVHRIETFERGESPSFSAVGRGGTAFAPAFDAIAESGITPVVAVYLTDLDGSFPASAPDYPVIWAAYGTRDTAPFGDTVHCE